MNREDERVFKQLVYEREHLRGWFHTPPARSSSDMIDLVSRVLARHEKREQEKKLARRSRCRSVPENRHLSSRGIAQETQTGESNYGASSVGFASGK